MLYCNLIDMYLYIQRKEKHVYKRWTTRSITDQLNTLHNASVIMSRFLSLCVLLKVHQLNSLNDIVLPFHDKYHIILFKLDYSTSI